MQNRPLAGTFESFRDMFGLGQGAIIAAGLFILTVATVGAYWFFHSTPPTALTISSGPEGSMFRGHAEKYRAILARSGVTLTILPSYGSQENLERLSNPTVKVDVGFVQGGITQSNSTGRLVSLGSVAYQPLLVFYRAVAPFSQLSEFSGKTLSIGPQGSGTRALALTLLATNGITTTGNTTLLDFEAGESASQLLDGKIDAIFLMGDSASSQVMRKLLHADGIYLFDFKQADAYVRRFSYLNKLELPMGSIDFGKNIPSNTVRLIGPTVELVARRDLHHALSDLLLEASREVHGGATLLQRRGEFPAPLEHDFPISDEATRFYKSGKTFLYRNLPFWLASLVNQVIVVIVPIIVLLIPGLRLIPTLYRWRIRSKIYRWYRALLAIERGLREQGIPEGPAKILQQLDEIEAGVNKMKLPAAFADQFYDLRGHINFVRAQLLLRSRSSAP